MRRIRLPVAGGQNEGPDPATGNWQPNALLLCAFLAIAACGASRIPESLRGYEILVDRHDAQGAELARALQDYGFRVRRAVRGGSRPTAALVFFTYRDPGSGTAPWLHLRLADTRSGVIVGAATIPLDSVGATPGARAEAAVRALLSNPIATPP
jgi:hypothetical protein